MSLISKCSEALITPLDAVDERDQCKARKGRTEGMLIRWCWDYDSLCSPRNKIVQS